VNFQIALKQNHTKESHKKRLACIHLNAPHKKNLQHTNNEVEILHITSMKLLEKAKRWLLMTWVFQGDPEVKDHCLPWKSLIFYL